MYSKILWAVLTETLKVRLWQLPVQNWVMVNRMTNACMSAEMDCTLQFLSRALGPAASVGLQVVVEVKMQSHDKRFSIQGHGFEHVACDWATGAQKVITQELLKAGADDSIELVNWEPDPNPKSFNPNRDVKSSMPFSPINKGFNLGWHRVLMRIYALWTMREGRPSCWLQWERLLPSEHHGVCTKLASNYL